MLIACLLTASALTLYFLNQLLCLPLHKAKAAPERYLTHQELPNLPNQFEDKAGILLKQVQQTLEQQNQLLEKKKDAIRLLSHNVQCFLNSSASSLPGSHRKPTWKNCMIMVALSKKFRSKTY